MLLRFAQSKTDPMSAQLRRQFGQKIQDRREKAGMTVVALAAELGVTPGYVYLIESGTKIPLQPVAVKLAEILKDDPEVYTVWAHAGRRRLATAHDAADKLEELLRAEGVDVGVVTGDEVRFTRRRRGTGQRRSESDASGDTPNPSVIAVPIIPEGSLPESQPADSDGYVEIQANVLPPHDAPTSPFAYKMTEDGARRVGRVLRAGDTVVISREAGPPTRNAIYAVNVGEKVALSKIVMKPRVLIMLSDEGEEQIDGIPIEGPDDLRTALVGRVVAVVRHEVIRP